MEVAHPAAGTVTGRRSALSAAAGSAILPVSTGLLCYAAVAQGGFYRSTGSFLAAGLIALALSAGVSGSGALVLGAALLGGGLAVAGFASGWGANAPQIVASLGAAIFVVPVVRHIISSGERARLLSAVSWIGAAASLVGMLGVAFHRTPWAAPASGLWRNASTLTYANAAGSLFVLTLGASILLLIEEQTSWRRVATYLTLAGLATTLSRGAAVAAVVAVIALMVVRATSILRSVTRPAVAAVIATAFFVPSMAGPAQPIVAIAGLVAGGAIAWGRGPVLTRRAVVIGAAVLVPIAVLASSAGLSRVFERRALPASETRLRTWNAVWERVIEKPITGFGPGTFSIVENDPKRGPVLTRYVHNEYLQVLYEAGVVGLAAVIGALLVFASWIWRRRRAEPAWALAAATCAGFAAHSGLDFLWRFPFLVALAFMWMAVAVTPPPVVKETS